MITGPEVIRSQGNVTSPEIKLLYTVKCDHLNSKKNCFVETVEVPSDE